MRISLSLSLSLSRSLSPSPHPPPATPSVTATLPRRRRLGAPADGNKLYIVHNKIGTVTNDMCIMRAEFYERTVVQRYEGYRIIAAFAICIVGSPLLILFIVSFITGMTRFFQRRINYTHYIVPSNFRGEKRRARVAARARAAAEKWPSAGTVVAARTVVAPR